MNRRRPWTAHEERLLQNFHEQGISLARISSRLNRTRVAVQVRLYALLRQESGRRDERDLSEEKNYPLATT
jgi:hypothetical protein